MRSLTEVSAMESVRKSTSANGNRVDWASRAARNQQRSKAGIELKIAAQEFGVHSLKSASFLLCAGYFLLVNSVPLFAQLPAGTNIVTPNSEPALTHLQVGTVVVKPK